MSSVSVQLYVDNAGAHLDATLRSVLAQLSSDAEFYIVDGGSTDGSFELLQRYAAAETRIRLEQQINGGIVKARQYMLTHSTMDYIMPLPANTVLLPGGVERLKHLLDRVSMLSGVYGKMAGYDLDIRKVVFVKGHSFSYFQAFSSNPVPTGTLMVRREAAIKAGGFVEVPMVKGGSPVGYDYFFALRLALDGMIHFDNNFIGVYLWRGEHQHVREMKYRDSRVYRWRRECRGDIADMAWELARNGCIGYLQQEHRRWFDDLHGGAKLQCAQTDVPVLLASLGAIVQMRMKEKKDYQNFLQTAVNLGINDFGIPMTLIDYCLNGNAVAMAEQIVEQALPIYKDDPYACMMLMQKKIRIIGQAPARQTELPAVMGLYTSYEQLYRGNEATYAAIAKIISGLTGNEVAHE